MGAGESSLLAVEERNACFRRGPELCPELYLRHTSGENIPGLLTQVPDLLTSSPHLYCGLDLSFNLLSSLPPLLPLTLPHLVTLNLGHNRLTALPEQIFGFLHLRELDVSHNLLTSLPAGLCLLERLRKLDLSHNQLTKLPAELQQLQQLEKLSLAGNPLQHLPLALGGLPRLAVILPPSPASPSPPPSPLPPSPSPTSSESSFLLHHLRACHTRATAAQTPDTLRPSVNIFPRVRGPVFDSKILNSGSAQSLFSQMQAQAVQTGNRLLTPLIPPLASTSLDAERLADCVLGMVYGAVLGDTLGQLTVGMTASEAQFHYSRDLLHLTRGAPDLHRSRWTAGEASPVSHLVLTTLDSVLAWAGVLDELDYTARLQQWGEKWGQAVVSPTLARLLEEGDREDVEEGAKELVEQGAVEDSFCLPPVVGLVVAQFHNIEEVKSDALRICGATHSSEVARRAVVLLAELLARLLQGGGLEEVESLNLEESEKEEGNGDKEDGEGFAGDMLDPCHPLIPLKFVLAAVPEFRRGCYRAALTDVVMRGGFATVNGCVAGAVFGLLGGYSALPSRWLTALQGELRVGIDKRCNQLLDLMGVP